MFQFFVFPGAAFYPCPIETAAVENRGTVSGAVTHVKYMGKLVINHIMTLFGMEGVSFHRVPDQHNRSAEPGLAENGLIVRNN